MKSENRIDSHWRSFFFPLWSEQIWKTWGISSKKLDCKNPKPKTTLFGICKKRSHERSIHVSVTSRSRVQRRKNRISSVITTNLLRKTPLIGRLVASELRCDSAPTKDQFTSSNLGRRHVFSVGKDCFPRLKSSFGSRIKRALSRVNRTRKRKSERLFVLKSSDVLRLDSTGKTWNAFTAALAYVQHLNSLLFYFLSGIFWNREEILPRRTTETIQERFLFLAVSLNTTPFYQSWNAAKRTRLFLSQSFSFSSPFLSLSSQTPHTLSFPPISLTRMEGDHNKQKTR